jgi:hypothetical protein
VPLPGLKDFGKALNLPHLKNAAALIWAGISAAQSKKRIIVHPRLGVLST